MENNRPSHTIVSELLWAALTVLLVTIGFNVTVEADSSGNSFMDSGQVPNRQVVNANGLAHKLYFGLSNGEKSNFA
ncbi:hypothetical protein FEZ41_11800 [Lentilactobacillus parafarraginis]|jgi:hypothetical protein|uniref:Uncharacterized protein n=1 Tax=Lentilactobacillus parafarraginis TaxID=390842 RepID=A0A5R9CR00_9LACO|nr:hypothetical protein [Lentilactobacillus parafarraginis]TLQ17385.1 hypothetical protein FEZ41_11800 [Lentilactobacillus parafarraginis]